MKKYIFILLLLLVFSCKKVSLNRATVTISPQKSNSKTLSIEEIDYISDRYIDIQLKLNTIVNVTSEAEAIELIENIIEETDKVTPLTNNISEDSIKLLSEEIYTKYYSKNILDEEIIIKLKHFSKLNRKFNKKYNTFLEKSSF